MSSVCVSLWMSWPRLPFCCLPPGNWTLWVQTTRDRTAVWPVLGKMPPGPWVQFMCASVLTSGTGSDEMGSRLPERVGACSTVVGAAVHPRLESVYQFWGWWDDVTSPLWACDTRRCWFGKCSSRYFVFVIQSLSHVRLFATPRTAACQAPLSSAISQSLLKLMSTKSVVSRLLLLLSCFSRVWLGAAPWIAAHQAPLSLGFFRQEYWSGLPFPSPLVVTAAAAAAKSHQSCLTLCDPIDGSLPGSAVPGILQARILELVVTSHWLKSVLSSSALPPWNSTATMGWRRGSGACPVTAVPAPCRMTAHQKATVSASRVWPGRSATGVPVASIPTRMAAVHVSAGIQHFRLP